MSLVWIIAKNSFREAYRDKLFLAFLVVAVVIVLLSFILGALSFDERTRILCNMGLTAMHVVTLGVAIVLGSFVVSREIDRQTYMTILTRPISRAQFLFGKYLGVLLMLLSCVVFFDVLMFFILSGQNLANLLVISAGVLVEGAVLLAISFLISGFVRPALAVFSGFGVFLIGNWLQEMHFFAQKSGDRIFILFAEAVSYVLPNLYRLNFRQFYYFENGVPFNAFAWASLHGLAWAVGLMFIAAFAFGRKNLV